ncbi:MAG: DUF1036 domain-containing protein [Bacteroidetes bacterium]|nr:MAG: DUF1036 domain-containing protein [Bacteroidota bacterium]
MKIISTKSHHFTGRKASSQKRNVVFLKMDLWSLSWLIWARNITWLMFESIIATLFLQSIVTAGLAICNGTSSKLSVAVGYEKGGAWYAEGWWNLAPGECAITIGGPLSNRYYYCFAKDDKGTWDGKYQFCVDPSNAFYLRDQQNCEKRGFFQIDVGNAKDYVQTLTSSSERENAPRGDWSFYSAITKTGLLSQRGWNFLLNNYVPHREPCDPIPDAGGNMWVVQYHDGYIVGNLCRLCRGSAELIDYFTGQGDGDCDARDSQGREYCFPRDAITLVKSHGLIDAIFIQGKYR